VLPSLFITKCCTAHVAPESKTVSLALTNGMCQMDFSSPKIFKSQVTQYSLTSTVCVSTQQLQH